MNGIDSIIEKILSSAKKQAQELLIEAQEIADAITTKQNGMIEEERASLSAAANAKAQDLDGKAKLSAQLEQKRVVQNERQKLIQQAFDNALASLASLPDDEYRALLVGLLQKACADGQGGAAVFNARDREKHGEAVIKALGISNVQLSDDTADIKGGVIVRRNLVDINCALETLVRMISSEAAFDVSNVLFK